MSVEQNSNLKFEIAHVLFIDGGWLVETSESRLYLYYPCSLGEVLPGPERGEG